ncbi:MAG: hypothetical protein LC667_17215, partial [Thioalkalivibrio sp.]|nr:hypothetical protein [Thioalkalivibrio sp.]
GLLMVVPHGNQMHVLLPKETDHLALLGFGIDPSNPHAADLCLTQGGTFPTDLVSRTGVCYVDLDKWQWIPGEGETHPAPPDPALPPGLLNASVLSGRGHNVEFPVAPGRARAKVAFLSGFAGRPCRLASWGYSPHPRSTDSLPERERLVNALEWIMENPGTRMLSFRKIGATEPINVPLPPAPSDGEIDMVLAHVPSAEAGDLPLLVGGTYPNPTDIAAHFAAYYRLLGNSEETVPPEQRRLPQVAAGHQSGRKCPVSITTGVGSREEKANRKFAAVGTYACMLATGTGT